MKSINPYFIFYILVSILLISCSKDIEVKIESSNNIVLNGGKLQLNAIVKVDGDYDSSLNWCIIDAVTQGTSISKDGLLKIAKDESAGSIRVKAFSNLDTSKSAITEIKISKLSNGLVGWWPFNGNAKDESGNGHNGKVKGASLVQDHFGNLNTAYSFNGSNNYIFCGNLSELSYSKTKTISISFWFLSISSAGVNSDPFDLRSSNNNSIQVCLNSPSANNIVLNNWNQKLMCGAGYLSTIDFQTEQWKHIVDVVDFESNKMLLYVNGQLITTKNITSTCNLLGRLNNPKLNIGSRFDFENSRCCYFKGSLDDIGIWNRAITREEVSDLYNSKELLPF